MPTASDSDLDEVFDYFQYVDDKFSTYKDSSEISRLNRGDLKFDEASEEMKLIFELAEQTRRESNGYFDIHHNGIIDPSGIVKGWAIYNAAEIFRKKGFENFYVDAGGDIQACGKNSQGEKWRVGIRNPFNMNEIVKVLSVSDCGVATSGTYVRGQHIYNPKNSRKYLDQYFESDRDRARTFTRRIALRLLRLRWDDPELISLSICRALRVT